jgi:hypothetical protein
MVCLFIWIIGYLITVSFLLHDAKAISEAKRQGLLLILLILNIPFWPITIGFNLGDAVARLNRL